MQVCVAGMHRSGTSMVAKLLHFSGIALGADAEFLPPNDHNPDGYWERRPFFELNEALLAALNGSWHQPPDFCPGWETQPKIQDLVEQAAAMIRELDAGPPWGWKDPRNSITLPFWKRLASGLVLVIPVRNPMEVAQSLHCRDGFFYARGLALWLEYHRRLLAWAPPNQRIVTHYETYFREPLGELQRLLDALGFPYRQADLERACAGIIPALKHYRLATTDLLDAGLPVELVDCYHNLCREAGWADGQQEERQTSPSEANAFRHLLGLEANLCEREERLHEAQERGGQQAEEMADLARRLEDVEKELGDLRHKQLSRRYVIADRLAYCYQHLRHPLRGLARHGRRAPNRQENPPGAEPPAG